MRFLIDENIRKEIGDFLQKSGHAIMGVPSGMENSEIIQLATKEKRILLTHDKHFANILLYPPEKFCGIIRIKIEPPIVSDIVNAMENFFRKLTSAQIDKHLIILEKEGFRIYPHEIH